MPMSKILTKEERQNKFNNLWPEWELIEYNGYFNSCRVTHKCGNEKCYQIYGNVERRGPTCQICYNRHDNNWYYNIGDKIDDLIIINRRMGRLQEYQYKCLKCGFDSSKPSYFKGKYIDEYWTQGRGIKNGNRCACCRGIVVQPGINDIATTDPEVVQYFAEPSDALKYGRGSESKVKQKCPICGRIADKLISVDNLVNEGRSCLYCGKSISYPERMMYFLLKELNVQFEMHKVFDWSKNVYDHVDDKFHKREYDFYIPFINTIVEIHGSQHYGDAFSFGRGIDTKEIQRIDEEKQILAELHKYNYVVINCNDSNKNYIANNILQSNLADMFDLTNINWDKISRKALNGIAKLIVDNKEENPDKSTVELAEEYGVHHSTVIAWLKKAGIYDKTFEQKNAGAKRSYPVYSIELNKTFRSMKLASEEIGVSAKCINSALLPNNKTKHAGKHPITGEPLTWEKWTIEQYKDWCKTNNISMNSLYTLSN